MPARQPLRANVIPRYTFAHDTDLPFQASGLAQGLPPTSGRKNQNKQIMNFLDNTPSENRTKFTKL